MNSPGDQAAAGPMPAGSSATAVDASCPAESDATGPAAGLPDPAAMPAMDANP